MKRYSTILIDDHTLIIEGLRAALSTTEFEVVADATSRNQGRTLIEHWNPEVVIVDFHLPDGPGIEVIAPQSQKDRAVYVVLTMSEDAHDLELAKRAGASAFVLKSAPITQLLNILRFALSYPNIFQSPDGIKQNKSFLYSLTEREVEVLKILPSGLTVKEIASLMFLSEATIKTHLSNLYRKMEVANRTQAIDKALKIKLISLE